MVHPRRIQKQTRFLQERAEQKRLRKRQDHLATRCGEQPKGTDGLRLVPGREGPSEGRSWIVQ
jgi:hypothetical protein